MLTVLAVALPLLWTLGLVVLVVRGPQIGLATALGYLVTVVAFTSAAAIVAVAAR